MNHRKATDSLMEAMFRNRILILVQMGASCKLRNTPEWMARWQNELNNALDAIGETDRVRLRGDALVVVGHAEGGHAA